MEKDDRFANCTPLYYWVEPLCIASRQLGSTQIAAMLGAFSAILAR